MIDILSDLGISNSAGKYKIGDSITLDKLQASYTYGAKTLVSIGQGFTMKSVSCGSNTYLLIIKPSSDGNIWFRTYNELGVMIGETSSGVGSYNSTIVSSSCYETINMTSKNNTFLFTVYFSIPYNSFNGYFLDVRDDGTLTVSPNTSNSAFQDSADFSMGINRPFNNYACVNSTTFYKFKSEQVYFQYSGGGNTINGNYSNPCITSSGYWMYDNTNQKMQQFNGVSISKSVSIPISNIGCLIKVCTGEVNTPATYIGSVLTDSIIIYDHNFNVVKTISNIPEPLSSYYVVSAYSKFYYFSKNNELVCIDMNGNIIYKTPCNNHYDIAILPIEKLFIRDSSDNISQITQVVNGYKILS